MTDVTFKGIDVTALMSAAQAQSVGSQKAKYAADVAASLGSNAIFEIRIGSTVVYRSTVSGSLVTSSSGILLPEQFVEPPSVNVANALTDPAAVIALRNATNSGVEVTVPVKAGGATGFLTASGALGGTQPTRTNNVLFKPPATLDVGSGGGGTPPVGSPIMSLDDLIDDQQLQSIAQPRFGTSTNAEAAVQAANYENVKGYVDAGPTTAFKHYDFMNEILPWFWVYAGPGHNDSLNLRLQYRGGVISVKRKSNEQWVDSTVRPGTAFDGYVWNGNSATLTMLSASGDIRNHSDGSRSSRFAGNTGSELWYTAVVNRELIADSRAVALVCECRIIDNNNNPYYGANGCYSIHIGFDFWGRSAPGGFYQDATNNRYWGKASNGSNSRWITVTNGDWKPCGHITMVSYNDQPGNAHTGDWSAATPWTLYPWVPDEAEIRANPPTWTV